MQISAGKADDDRALAVIDDESWSPLTDPSEQWSVERPFFGESTGHRPEDVLVAHEDSRLLGVIKVCPDASEFGDWCINGLAVAREAQGRGVGTALIEAACDRVGEAGASTIWLKVLDTNVRAKRLYTRLGFVEVARYTSPFAQRPGVDDLRMSARLPLRREDGMKRVIGGGLRK